MYSVDYARGIDILKFNRTGEVPTEEEFKASWVSKLGSLDPAANRERMMCELSTLR